MSNCVLYGNPQAKQYSNTRT